MASMQELEILLNQTLEPNTTVVSKAVNTLNRLLKKPSSIKILLDVIKFSEKWELKQLAAVLLRKRIVGHWIRLDENLKDDIKKTLLTLLGENQILPAKVRKSCGDVVSIIARITVPNREWDELLQFLFHWSQSPNPDHRESALLLFASLSETIGDYLRPQFSVLNLIISQGLDDQVSKIRLAALKAVSPIASWLSTDDEVKVFREIIPKIIKVTRICIQEENEEEVLSIFEVFEDLLEITVPLISKCLPDIIQFSLEIGANKNYSYMMRETAMTFINSVALSRPKIVINNKLIEPILQVVFPMVAEKENEEEIEESETIHKFGSQMINSLALCLPPKHFYPLITKWVAQFSQNQDPLCRRASAIVLAVICEGCSEIMKDSLSQSLPFVFNAMSDSESMVREAGCLCMGQFADQLLPDIVKHNDLILPRIYQVLNDSNDKVISKCCYALESFVQNVPSSSLQPFLAPLMEKLVQILINQTNPETQELTISAISATATAAGKNFAPYFSIVFNIMGVLMQKTEKEYFVIRARATECIGILAEAVGPEIFAPHLNDVMNEAIKGLSLDHSEIREFTFNLFVNLSQAFQGVFNQYLPHIMPSIIQSCESSDGITEHTQKGKKVPLVQSDINNNNNDNNDNNNNLLSEGESDEALSDVEDIESDEDDDITNLSVRTSFLDEKTSATLAIGFLAKSSGITFLQYVPDCLTLLKHQSLYFHSDVRGAALVSLVNMAKPVTIAYPNPDGPWIKGDLARQLSPQVRDYVDKSLKIIFRSIEKDDDKEVVMNALDALCDLCKELGPMSLHPHLDTLGGIVVKVLTKTTTSQMTFDESDDEDGVDEDDPDEDQDIELFDSLTDFLIEMANVFGATFFNFFDTLLPYLLKYTKSSNHHSYFSSALGPIAEIIKKMEVEIPTSHLQLILPVSLKGINNSVPNLQRVGAYTLGLLIERGPKNETLSLCPQALSALYPLFSPDREAAIIDNACGATARILKTHPNSLPLKQIFPTFLERLPLREDFEEDEPVCTTLLFFVLTPQFLPIMSEFMAKIISIFAKTLERTSLSLEIRVKIVDGLKVLSTQYATEMSQIFQSLPSNEQQILSVSMSSQIQ